MEFVYLVQDVNDPTRYKVGFTTRIRTRMIALAKSSKTRLRFVWFLAVEKGRSVERGFMKLWGPSCIHGEWFRLDASQVAGFRSVLHDYSDEEIEMTIGKTTSRQPYNQTKYIVTEVGHIIEPVDGTLPDGLFSRIDSRRKYKNPRKAKHPVHPCG